MPWDDKGSNAIAASPTAHHLGPELATMPDSGAVRVEEAEVHTGYRDFDRTSMSYSLSEMRREICIVE